MGLLLGPQERLCQRALRRKNKAETRPGVYHVCNNWHHDHSAYDRAVTERAMKNIGRRMAESHFKFFERAMLGENP